MSGGCYLAVDGGGTKTEIALTDRSGAVIDTAQCGGTNHESFADGYDGMYAVLQPVIDGLLSRNHVRYSEIVDGVFGLAGADHRYQVVELEKRMHQMRLPRVLVCNDGFLPVWGNTRDGVGIAYNCGTGVCCGAIDSHGSMRQLGGLGNYTGDFGGGSVIAQQVWGAVYDQLFVGGQVTKLTELYMQSFCLRDRDEFFDSVQLVENRDKDCGVRLVQLFFTALKQGDEVAAAISERMASRGADYIAAAYRSLQFHPVTQVVLTGSIHTAAPSQQYRMSLEQKLQERLPGCLEITVAVNKPIAGAIRWACSRNQA